MSKNKKVFMILNIIVSIVLLIILVYITIIYSQPIIAIVKDPRIFKNFINSYGVLGIFVFMFFQAIQVIIPMIPGEFTQFAGGYIYGTILGSVYSTIGLLLGAIVSFFAARLLGISFLKLFISPKTMGKFKFLINSKKSEFIMFVLFLIPGIPKDILVYISGITPIKPSNFFIIYTIARLPSIIAASYVGSSFGKGNYLNIIIISGIVCILFIIGMLNKDKLVAKLKIHKD